MTTPVDLATEVASGVVKELGKKGDWTAIARLVGGTHGRKPDTVREHFLLRPDLLTLAEFIAAARFKGHDPVDWLRDLSAGQDEPVDTTQDEPTMEPVADVVRVARAGVVVEVRVLEAS